jgi:hypothetical protein
MKEKMDKIQIITLCIAIIGAVTGTISFSLQMWEKLKYRPRLSAEIIGVYVLPSEGQTPDIAVVVEYRNPSKDRITILRTPDIIVKDKSGKKLGKFNLDPSNWNEPVQYPIGPQEVKGVPYRGRELSDAISTGIIPELSSLNDDVFFELEGESTAGQFTARTSGIRCLDKSTIDWLKKEGGIQTVKSSNSEQVAPPDKK